MLRVVPMDCFDDVTGHDFWEPSMDRVSNIFSLLHPDMAQYRKRRRFGPFSTRMLRRNPSFPPVPRFLNFDEDLDDSEPEGWVCQVYVPASCENAKTRSEKSGKTCKELTKDKSDADALTDSDCTKDGNTAIAADQVVEKAPERIVAIARPLPPQKFSVRLDVSGYKPDNIAVKIRDRTVSIDAKHQETHPNTGVFVQRELHRSYALPKHVDPDAVVSSLDKNGLLTVEAPQEALPDAESRENAVEAMDQPAAENKRSSESEIQNAVNAS